MSYRTRKIRRSSGILKKDPPDGNDVTADQTDDTLLGHPSRKRLSKRVSFADTTQIKVIKRMEDLGKNWPDSTSSSEEGLSALADVSNLVTPNIKKAQPQQACKTAENMPQSLQNLLRGTLIGDDNSAPKSTNSSCPRDVSGIARNSNRFSFFDNSKLGFGEMEVAESDVPSEENTDEIENCDLVASFYTKDFLRSLKLDKKENCGPGDVAKEKRYPHVNPPSYKQCVEGAGRKSYVPTTQVQAMDCCQASISSNNEDAEEMDFTCTTPGMKAIGNGLPTKEVNNCGSTESGDMDLTCAVQVVVKAADETPHSSTIEKSSSDDQGDMELTCALQPRSLAATSAKHSFDRMKDHEMVGNITLDDMDLTCAEPRTMIPHISESERYQSNAIGESSECMSSASEQSAKPKSDFLLQEVCAKDGISDEMEFTCVVPVRPMQSEEKCTSSGTENLLKDGGDGNNPEETLKQGDGTIIMNQSISESVDFKSAEALSLAVASSSNVDETSMIEGSGHESDLCGEVTDGLCTSKSYQPLTQSHDITNGDGKCKSKQSNGSETAQQKEQEITVADPQQENSRTASVLSNEVAQIISRQDAYKSSSELEDITFASPLKMRLHKIRNSIGLYKAVWNNTRPEKFSLDSVSEASRNDDSLAEMGAKHLGDLEESCDQHLVSCAESKVSCVVDIVPDEDHVFAPDTQNETAPLVRNQDLFDAIPESQEMEQQSPEVTQSDVVSGSNAIKDTESSEHVENNVAEKNESERSSNQTACLVIESGSDGEFEQEHHLPGISLPGDQTDALGLSVSLHKILMDDICQELSAKKEENITVQEFLRVYTEINIGNFKKSRHSVVVPSAKLQAPTGLRDMFEAKYWSSWEGSIRESCIELMRNKIEGLEESISNLENQFHVSNPEVFRVIRNKPVENSDLLSRMQRLATDCKSLGNVFWKRDAMKLSKGLKKELSRYVDQNLLPATRELEPCKELLDRVLRKIEEESERLDESLQTYELRELPPTVEDATLYLATRAELDALKSKREELLSKRESLENRRDCIRGRRTKLMHQIIDQDFAAKSEVKTRQAHQSLASLQKSSYWKLLKVIDNALVFSLLSDSVVFTASFEEGSSWDWERKIVSFSLGYDVSSERVLPFEVNFYKLLHKAWGNTLDLSNLVTEYSNFSGLKNVLEVLSNISFASRDLLDDKNWINCRLVCKASVCVEKTLITVSFLPPQSGVDGFTVNFFFTYDDSVSKAAVLDHVLRDGFVPTSHECIMGKRCLDHLGKQDIESILSSVEAGRHYLKRAVDALLKKIEYKFWA